MVGEMDTVDVQMQNELVAGAGFEPATSGL